MKANPSRTRSYDYEITMLSDDGRFDPTAIPGLKQSVVELGLMDRAPKDDEMLTEQFVPVKF